jgi:pilus assembly protein CpaE
VATSRILLISDAGDSVVVDALRGAAHETTVATDVASALEIVTEGTTAEVIVLDLAGTAADLVEASQAIKASPALAGLPILCVSQTDDVEDRILLLEAGADDVIARPFDARELDARAEALALRLHRSRDLGAVASTGGITIRDSSHRRVIAVYSPKGGVGTTTVAVNIATWLAGQLPGAVAILDLDFQFGQVSTHLNIETRMTMAELVRDEATLRDPGLFAAALDRHGSGLMVLGAPASPDVVSGVTAEALATLLATASAAFQVVVVDAGSVLDARSETVLTHATDIVVVVTPEFPALKAVHALGEILNLSSGELGETSYVLNEIFSRELLRLSHIEEALGTRVALTIPYDAFAFLKSVNEGVPLVEGSPKTPAAEQLRRLAARVAGLPSAASAPVERKARGLGSLFSRS